MAFQSSISDLTTDLDNLDDALTLLQETASTPSASTLPLLDQAKLHTLNAYAIESLLFSYLRLQSVDAKSHPIYQELGRVKQYFAKIAETENPAQGGAQGPNMRIDKAAVGRFLKKDLAANDQIGPGDGSDPMIGVERTHIKFDEGKYQGGNHSGVGGVDSNIETKTEKKKGRNSKKAKTSNS
ncbi:MAG: hypothetical protein M1814_006274 [Vezdaea aestivalis]|nr:MAG: hypothetical protein M1814_006274 [Vezdaea aestivalis]